MFLGNLIFILIIGIRQTTNSPDGGWGDPHSKGGDFRIFGDFSLDREYIKLKILSRYS